MSSRGFDSKYVLWFHVAMSVVLAMYLLQSMGQSTELMHDIADQGTCKMWIIIFPELPQIASVRPLEHEIALMVSGDRRKKIDDVRMIDLGNLFVRFDFFSPLIFKFALLGSVFGVGLLHFLDCNVGLCNNSTTYVSKCEWNARSEAGLRNLT